MNKKKLAYEAPNSNVLEFHSEGVVCGSPVYGSPGSAGSNSAFNDYGSDF